MSIPGRVRIVLNTTLTANGLQRCWNHACMYGSTGGVGTNGPCDCEPNWRIPSEVRLFVRRQANVIRALAERTATAEFKVASFQRMANAGDSPADILTCMAVVDQKLDVQAAANRLAQQWRGEPWLVIVTWAGEDTEQPVVVVQAKKFARLPLSVEDRADGFRVVVERVDVPNKGAGG